jgi:hypothetical protein
MPGSVIKERLYLPHNIFRTGAVYNDNDYIAYGNETIYFYYSFSPHQK